MALSHFLLSRGPVGVEAGGAAAPLEVAGRARERDTPAPVFPSGNGGAAAVREGGDGNGGAPPLRGGGAGRCLLGAGRQGMVAVFVVWCGMVGWGWCAVVVGGLGAVGWFVCM